VIPSCIYRISFSRSPNTQHAGEGKANLHFMKTYEFHSPSTLIRMPCLICIMNDARMEYMPRSTTVCLNLLFVAQILTKERTFSKSAFSGLHTIWGDNFVLIHTPYFHCKSQYYKIQICGVQPWAVDGEGGRGGGPRP